MAERRLPKKEGQNAEKSRQGRKEKPNGGSGSSRERSQVPTTLQNEQERDRNADNRRIEKRSQIKPKEAQTQHEPARPTGTGRKASFIAPERHIIAITSPLKATETQSGTSSSDDNDITVIERKKGPQKNERRASQDTGFEEEQALSTDEEEEDQARKGREHRKEEAQKKEAEAAAEEFKANLELQKKRMKERRAMNERKAERWNDFQIENRNYLVAKEKMVSLRREAAQEEPRVVQKPKITLEKPIYKARTIVTSWGRLPGNHYGLSQEEASFHDKARIAEALKKQAQGARGDQNVLDAWYNSDVRKMQRDMEEPRHRLHEYTKKASWNLLEEGRCEPKPEHEDMQVVHYLFSFLNWPGIKRRFLELIEEGLFQSERLGQYMACSFRVGGKHLLHTFRCLWVHLYEHADFEMPAVHRDLAPKE
ncbi:unnamed protein product [Oikopleura dioica]|uniref:Uncharacterized protein n=1 Tax=Oikopleura dioica TaxID=34765 RepID=E4XMC1_OIKDI|nr:unnamed protein product [Oikopleura dioica]